MPGKLRFAALSILFAAVMYAALIWAALRFPFVPANLGYMVPVLAVVLAAVGATPGRKAAFVAGSLSILLLVDVLAAVSGLQAAAVSVNADIIHADTPGLLAVAVFHVFSIGFPLAVLVAFVGRRPKMLWQA